MLFVCEEWVGRIFKKKKLFRVVDEESCTGLDGVVYTGEQPETQTDTDRAVYRAVARRFLSKSAAASLREDAVYDVSQWDATLLKKPFGAQLSSVTAYNCLTRAGFQTVGDLVALNEIQIMKIRYISWKTISCVQAMLRDLEIIGSAWDTFQRSER